MTAAVAEKSSEWGGELLDLDAYLRRVGFRGEPEATAETLRALHRAHVASIPFENIDVMLRQVPALDVTSLQAKMVHRARGGYCHEHNLLFGAVLERCGFQVDRLLGRIRMGVDRIRPRGHIVLRVRAGEGTWLADVGFGSEGPLEPLPFRDGATARQGDWSYQLVRVAGAQEDAWRLRTRHPEGWFDLYEFTTAPQHAVDFVAANHFTATAPMSPFTGSVIVQRMGPHARICLRDQDLTTTRHDGDEEHRRVPVEEYRKVLHTVFGVDIDDDQVTGLRLESRQGQDRRGQRDLGAPAH